MGMPGEAVKDASGVLDGVRLFAVAIDNHPLPHGGMIRIYLAVKILCGFHRVRPAVAPANSRSLTRPMPRLITRGLSPLSKGDLSNLRFVPTVPFDVRIYAPSSI